MGGLKRYMPVTYWTMTVAVFAIAGFPPLAAFFSKDAILDAAFMQEGSLGKVFWFVGLVTALLTSFYMFRLWYLTFQGERRSAHDLEEHGATVHARPDTKLTIEAEHAHEPHESPWSMLGPLVILAILSDQSAAGSARAASAHTWRPRWERTPRKRRAARSSGR